MLNFSEFELENTEIEMDAITINNQEETDDMAIIGVSFKLPQANDLEELWDNVKRSKDSIRKIPRARKEDVERYFKAIENREPDGFMEMGYLNEIDKFDYKFFNISPSEASLMDPNQRMFLEEAWKAIEDAGYGKTYEENRRTGVYVGYCTPVVGTYMDIIRNTSPEKITAGMVGNMPAMIPGRIGYFKDYKGPSFYLDTACSSSLVALHNACIGIKNGDCEMAVVGASELVMLPVQTGEKMGIESSSNRTKAFDDASDGTGAGEGVIAMVVKKRSKAIEDNDNIYAIIKGSAINQDGNSIGITAPNSVAQEDVIKQAWRSAEIDPETISYIETHGTATNLGDPIEMDGITRAFNQVTDRKQFCALGAFKSNIGHLGSGAGLAGVLKAIASLQNRQLAPIVHLQMPNRKIDFENSPVYPNDVLKPWEPNGEVLRCGVSSFGLSGTNCHVILEEAPPLKDDRADDTHTEILFTLSAKTESALKNYIWDYIAFLNETKEDIRDICYTANVGREDYKYRLGLVAKSKKECIELLKKAYVDMDQTSENMYFSKNLFDKVENSIVLSEDEIRENSRQINRVLDTASKGSILESYVSGSEIDWRTYYLQEKRRRVSVPSYPFDKLRAWVDVPEFIHQETRKDSKQPEKTIDLEGRESGIYSETEKHVANVWGESLGYKSIQITDSYYELGGDSVIGMQIVNSLSTKLGTEVGIKDLLTTLTIEKMAEKVESLLECSSGRIEQVIQKTPLSESYPLSSAQKRMYITSTLEEAGVSYNIYGAMHIEGPLDVEKFEDILNKLIQRHEAFRTSFQIIDGEPRQIIHKDARLSVDVKEIKEAMILTEYQNFVQPFNLEEAPLMRAAVRKYGKNQCVFMFDMHHIISDGVSMGIFMEEFMRLYKGEALEPIDIQYKDFAVWQNDYFESEAIKAQEKYWLENFEKEVEPLDFDYDHLVKLPISNRGDSHQMSIDEALYYKVLKLAKSNNTTLYNVLLSAYNVLLMRTTGTEDICVGSASMGRPNTQCEKIVGMFVNMLAMRNYVNPKATFTSILQSVTENSITAFSNQDYQFEKLVEKLGIQRNANGHFLFDTTFTLQNLKGQDLEIEDLKIRNLDYDINTAAYPLSMIAFEGQEGVGISFEYQTDLFKKETVEKLGHQFVEILQQVVEPYDMEIAQIHLSGEAQLSVDTSSIEKELDFGF